MYGEPDIIEIGKIFEDADSAIEFEEAMIDELNAVKDLRWLNCQNAGKSFNSTKSKNKGYKLGIGKDNPRYGIQYTPSPESNEKRKKLCYYYIKQEKFKKFLVGKIRMKQQKEEKMQIRANRMVCLENTIRKIPSNE